MRRIAVLTWLIVQMLLAAHATAGREHPQCFAETVSGGPRLAEFADVIWNGNRLLLTSSGWVDSRSAGSAPDGAGDIRRQSEGVIGVVAPGLPAGYQVCWSARPFSFDETQGGEVCRHEGPLALDVSSTYYRMNIDSTGTDPACAGQTCYCQVAITTGSEAGRAGDTTQIAYEWGTTALGFSSEFLWGHDCCDRGVGGQQFVAIDPVTGRAIAWGSPQGNQQIQDIDFDGEQIYAVTGGAQGSGDDPGTLGRIDPRTGRYTVIGSSPLVPGARLTGLAIISGIQAYVSATNGGLYRVNLRTGATQFVGNQGLLVNDLAVDSRGNVYAGCALDRQTRTRSFCSVDTNTGAATFVNEGAFDPLEGFPALAFDDRDTLWFVRTSKQGGGTVDPQTGEVTLLWTPSGGSGSAPFIGIANSGGLSIPLIQALLCETNSEQC